METPPDLDAVPLSEPPARTESVFRFRSAVLRGLAVTLPPVLTIVILAWAINTVRQYVLTPVEDGVRELLVWRLADIQVEPAGEETRKPQTEFHGVTYQRLAPSGQYIPLEMHQWLRTNVPDAGPFGTGKAAYRAYVDARYLRPQWVVPIFSVLFLLFLYVLGRLLAAGIWDIFERGLLALPIVRSVYSSVRKVTNFLFTENQQHYKRVVAVEYPRKGIWSIGLVTSEGVSLVNDAAREPTVTVLLPGSPTPITGYCVMVPTRETYDIRMTIDQALQFYISCGVSVPPHQMRS
jgi:uncharacterized membrane protein